MKLVRIVRTGRKEAFLSDHIHQNKRAYFIEPAKLDERPIHRTAEFFEIEDIDLEATVKLFATSNPGMEVQVYQMTQESICPAGDMVTKQVTKEGILPSY
jgi:hypothetical protein